MGGLGLGGHALVVEIALQDKLRGELVPHGLAFVAPLIGGDQHALGLLCGEAFIPGNTGQVADLFEAVDEGRRFVRLRAV